MSTNINKSQSNDIKIDKLLSQFKNYFDPDMISPSKLYGLSSNINRKFKDNRIKKTEKDYLT